MRASWLPLSALGFAILVAPSLAGPPEPRLKLVLQVPPSVAVSSVAVSPDGSLVATAAGEGGVRLYDARTGEFQRAIGDAGDRGVAFSPDGRTLTAAGFHMDKLSGVFDVTTGKRTLALAGHTEWEVDATAFSPDGKLLASTGTDQQILIWDLATGRLRHQLKNQPARIAAMVFSPDGSTFATGGGDNLVHLWDTQTGRLRRSFAGHRDWIAALSFSPDGTTIASGSCDWGFHRGHDWLQPAGRSPESSEWRLWDAASGELKRVVPETGRMLAIAYAPDGKSVVCGVDNDLRQYDFATATPGKVVVSHDATITSIAFTPDGSAVITGSHDQTAKRTNLKTGMLEWQAPGSFEQVNSVAISDDAKILVTGSGDQRFARMRVKAGASEIGPGAVRLWDARTGRMLMRLGDPTEQVMAVAVSADGKQVADGAATKEGAGVVHVWEAATGAAVWSANDHVKEVLTVAFAPDGSTLASGSADGIVKIRDVRSGKFLHTLADHRGGATSLAFSPDGAVLYCGQGYGGAKIWDTRTGQPLQTCEPAGSQAESFTIDRLLNSIGLSRDGKTLATCASSVNNEFVDPVRLWDAHSGTLRRTFAAENIHGRPMALSPDSSIVATGGKSVKLWDVKTGKMIRELFGHLKRTQSIIFSADGRLVISGGSYGTTNTWETATGRHLVTLFSFLENRDGKPVDEWLAYHPDGYYDGSPGIERRLAWRVGDELQTAATLAPQLHRPEKVHAALAP